MRFFVALEIPNSAQKEIELIQDKLKGYLPNIRLTDPQKLHLTIAFIGEREDSLKESLIYLLNTATEGIPAFSITPAFIDGFPNIHAPKTVFIGVSGEIDKLMVLRERVKDGLQELSIEVDDRRFVPHVAIAKFSSEEITQHQEELIQKLMLETKFQDIKITSIKLFESIPNQGFHSHNTLAEIILED